MKKMNLVLIIASLFAGFTVQASTIYCMGGSPEIDLEGQTVAAASLGIPKENVAILTGQDESGNSSYSAVSPSFVLISVPKRDAGWGGGVDTFITNLKTGQTIKTLCHVK